MSTNGKKKVVKVFEVGKVQTLELSLWVSEDVDAKDIEVEGITLRANMPGARIYSFENKR